MKFSMNCRDAFQEGFGRHISIEPISMNTAFIPTNCTLNADASFRSSPTSRSCIRNDKVNLAAASRSELGHSHG